MTANLTYVELEKLRQATPKTWDSVVDAIKVARGGEYPPDWGEKVLFSGLLERVGVKPLRARTFDNISDALDFIRGRE